MKTKFLISLLLCTFQLSAQKYGTTVGLRVGEARFGLSVKQRIVSQFSLEGISEVTANTYEFAFLPKFHLPIIGDGLNLYFGAGMHSGARKEFGSFYGYDIMGGIEWKIPAVPLVVSADVKPSYHVNGVQWFEFPAAVSVHYVLSKETRAKRLKHKEKRARRKERREEREERREKRKEFWQKRKE